MSGKTSLVKVASSIVSEKGFKTIYVNLIGVRGVRDAGERILSSIPRSLVDRLAGLRGFLELFGVRIGVEAGMKTSVGATRVLEKVFLELSRRENLLVVLDEVQEIRGGIRYFLSMLYRVLTSSRNIVFVFTGSAIGLMNTLLNPSPDNPLYGRTPIKIELRPWSIETSLEFLENGLDKCGCSYSVSELREVVETLGRLPGWLSFYGLRRCMGLPHRSAVDEALKQAIKIARNEIDNIVRYRGEWCIKALKLMVYGARWSELLRETRVSKQTLSNLLKTLEKLYFIEKHERQYYIADPVYRKAILTLP